MDLSENDETAYLPTDDIDEEFSATEAVEEVPTGKLPFLL